MRAATASIATARAAAVQKSRVARFRANGSRIGAVVMTTATDSQYVVPMRDLGREFGVMVQGEVPEIEERFRTADLTEVDQAGVAPALVEDLRQVEVAMVEDRRGGGLR